MMMSVADIVKLFYFFKNSDRHRSGHRSDRRSGHRSGHRSDHRTVRNRSCCTVVHGGYSGRSWRLQRLKKEKQNKSVNSG